MPEGDNTVELKKHNVRVVFSSLGNERRTINFQDMDEGRVQELIETVSRAFGVIRQSDALFITGSDGVVVFANIKNIAFVEVHVG